VGGPVSPVAATAAAVAAAPAFVTRTFEELLPRDDAALTAEYQRCVREAALGDQAAALAPAPARGPAPALASAPFEPAGDTAAVVAMIAQLAAADEFLEFPDWAESEWTLDDCQSFFDSCGQWQPGRK